MPWVVTRLCRDCKDTSCVSVCPVDCFYEPLEPTPDLPDQLYIHPEECIDCGACEPACPWEAIFQDDEVPDALAEDTALNARCDGEAALFRAATHRPQPPPTPDAVAANKRKRGL